MLGGQFRLMLFLLVVRSRTRTASRCTNSNYGLNWEQTEKSDPQLIQQANLTALYRRPDAEIPLTNRSVNHNAKPYPMIANTGMSQICGPTLCCINKDEAI